MYNVSMTEIQNGITYISENFMKKLLQNGEDIIQAYKEANQSLNSEIIEASIKEQQVKFDEICREFSDILATATNLMGESLETIQQNSSTINSILSNH